MIKTIFNLLVIIIIMLVTIACRQNNDFKKITIASQGCHGTCPIIALEIDKDLNVKYYGGEFAKNKGNYTTKITQKYWESLINKLKQSKYLELDSNYNNNNDLEFIEIIIQDSKSKKHIKGFYEDMPKDFKAVIMELLDLPNNLKLENTTDSLIFETTFQKAKTINDKGITKPMFPPKNN